MYTYYIVAKQLLIEKNRKMAFIKEYGPPNGYKSGTEYIKLRCA